MGLVLGRNSILHHLWAPVRQKYGNSDGAFGRLCCDGKSCKGKCITLAIPRPSVPRTACTCDWTGGFIKNDDSADDVRDIDLSIVHFLSGPVGVRGAKPGRSARHWRQAGQSMGLQRFLFEDERGRVSDRALPARAKIDMGFPRAVHEFAPCARVSFAGMIHPGLIGCLPAPKLLETWNARETGLIATAPERVPPLANPPFAATRAQAYSISAARRCTGILASGEQPGAPG